jgi:hypothetical protein
MSRRRHRSFIDLSPTRLACAAVVVASLCATGCVQRRMTVRSNVPGAQVYVDNYEIGRTPVSTDFIYYGQRDIRLVKDGYETLKVKQTVNAPWYQYPGLDFITENLWPWEVRDERNFNYQMQPQYLVPTETILSRAEEMRSQNPVTTVPAATTVSPYAAQPSALPPGTVEQPGAAPTSPYAPAPTTGAPRL